MSTKEFDKLISEFMGRNVRDEVVESFLSIIGDAKRRGLQYKIKVTDEETYSGMQLRICKLIVELDPLVVIKGVKVPGMVLVASLIIDSAGSYATMDTVNIHQRMVDVKQLHPHRYQEFGDICTSAPLVDMARHKPTMLIPTAISAASTITEGETTGPLGGYWFCSICKRWGKESGVNLDACCFISGSLPNRFVCRDCSERMKRKCPKCGMSRCVACLAPRVDTCFSCNNSPSSSFTKTMELNGEVVAITGNRYLFKSLSPVTKIERLM